MNWRRYEAALILVLWWVLGCRWFPGWLQDRLVDGAWHWDELRAKFGFAVVFPAEGYVDEDWDVPRVSLVLVARSRDLTVAIPRWGKPARAELAPGCALYRTRSDAERDLMIFSMKGTEG